MLSNVFKFLGVASVDSNLMPNSSDSVIRIVVIPKESNSLNKNQNQNLQEEEHPQECF
jgi:hypothetical protein